MNTDRRHELQHNQLADALESSIDKVRPYGRLIVSLVVLFFVITVGFAYVAGKGAERIAGGWDEYFEAFNAGDRAKLMEISERFAGTSVAAWARICAADMALSEGSSKMFNAKGEARDLLKQAADNYQSVLANDPDDTLKQRAFYGLARAHESLGDLEDLTKAREEYKKLAEGWPEGVYAAPAKSRLEDLERPATKEFYDWFVKYEPRKATGTVGKKPEFLDENLDSGDMSLPPLGGDAFKPSGTGATPENEKPAPDLPLEDLKLPGDEPAAPKDPATSGTSAESPPAKPADSK